MEEAAADCHLLGTPGPDSWGPPETLGPKDPLDPFIPGPHHRRRSRHPQARAGARRAFGMAKRMAAGAGGLLGQRPERRSPRPRPPTLGPPTPGALTPSLCVPPLEAASPAPFKARAALTDLSPPDLGQVTLEAPQGSEASSVLPDYGLGQTTRLCFHIYKRGVKITPESQGTVSTEEVLSEGCLSCDLLYEQRGAVIWPRTHSYRRQGQASFRPGPAPWRPCQPLRSGNGTGGPGPITKVPINGVRRINNVFVTHRHGSRK